MGFMAKNVDICIRGSGIVARSLALHLASKRLSVALTQGPEAPAGNVSHSDVRAYALNQASRTLLEAIRCWPEQNSATPVTCMQVHGDDGGNVEFKAQDQGVEALNWIVDVPALEGLLKEAVKFQPLIQTVQTPQPAALTVVCEGRSSATRSEFGVDFEVAPYGQSALATRVRCEKGHAQVARQWFDKGEILAFLPLGGPEGDVCAIVWSVSPERAKALQDETEAAFCEALQAASHGELGRLELTSPRNVWALQHAQARRWSGTNPQGAWVLAGDAAHNVHPLAGQGLNLGLGDVAELVRILDTRDYWRSVADPKLLRQYERARKADLAMIGNAGDSLQQLFANPHPALQALRNWGMSGFENSGLLKQWVTRRAMGTSNPR